MQGESRNPFKRSLKRFLVTNLSEAEDQRFKGVGPKGMFLNRLKRALDLSKNGLEKRKGIWATGRQSLTITVFVNAVRTSSVPNAQLFFAFAPTP